MQVEVKKKKRGGRPPLKKIWTEEVRMNMMDWVFEDPIKRK